jgi:serine phosphatase RsbU (regulator of sigma subunit)/tetratricopeptide (TPR) repeat protein
MEQLSSSDREKLSRQGNYDLEILEDAAKPIHSLVLSKHNELLHMAFVEDNFGNILASSNRDLLRPLMDSFTLPEDSKEIEEGVYQYESEDGTTVLDVIYPVVDTEGRTLCRAHFHIRYSQIQDQVTALRVDYLQLILLVWLIGAAGLFLLVYLVMNPFRRLAEWVKQMGQPGVVEEMDIDASTEVGEIAQAFSEITQKLRISQENLAEQERLQKEMQVAQEIQQTLLPSEFPELEGYQIASYYEAAKEVGGDYFDFVEVDKDTLGIVVGDVSGKGVPGSLVMTMIRTALRTEARGVKDAAEVLAKVNDFVVNDMKKGMFVTLFYVIIDSKRRRLNYASAGHNPMILYRASTQQTYYLNPRGFPIGISLPDSDLFRKSIESDTIALTEDDILIIYTDGITEAMNQKRQLFGEERFLEGIRKNGNLAAETFVENLQQDILSFTEGMAQNDDITLVSIKEKTTAEKLELKRAKKVFELVQENVSIKEACDEVGISTYAYYNKYKEGFESVGISAFDDQIDVEPVEGKHLSIEEKTKIYDIIRRHPEYGTKRISDELSTEYYGDTKISESKLYDELVRARLNTKELRETFVNRGGRRRKRLKPPGTPMLTIDGRVIKQKPGYQPAVDREDESEKQITQSSQPKKSETPPPAEQKKEVKEASETAQHRDLLGVTAGELFGLSLEDLFDKRETLVGVEESEPLQLDQSTDVVDLISEPRAPAATEAEESLDELDLDVTHEEEREVEEEELEFVDMLETTEGIEDDPEESSGESEPADVEDVTVVEETENILDLSDTFEEFLEVEQERDIITPEESPESDISDQILKHELQMQLDQAWDPLDPAETEEAESTDGENKQESPAQDRLDFDGLILLLNQQKAGVSEPGKHKTTRDLDNGNDRTPQKRTQRIAQAVNYYKSGQYTQTIAEAEKLINEDPENQKLYVLLGNAYFRSQRYREAVHTYEAVLRLDPRNTDAYENLGVVYANQGDFTRAVAHWEKLLQITPQRRDIRNSIDRAKKFLEQF